LATGPEFLGPELGVEGFVERADGNRDLTQKPRNAAFVLKLEL